MRAERVGNPKALASRSWATVRASRLAPYAAAALVVLASSVVVATVATSRTAAQPARDLPAVEAGEAAATRILELPVPLHQAARETLAAVREARQAIARPTDGEGLSTARSRIQKARAAIAGFENDQGLSPQQRYAVSELNRQLQRVLVALDSPR